MKRRYLQSSVTVVCSVLILLFIVIENGGTYYDKQTNHQQQIKSIFNNSIEEVIQRQKIPLNNRNETVELPWWDGGECSNRTPTLYDDEVYGHCGRRASALGSGQKVISMSLYGKSREYWMGMEENLNRIEEFYPGYTLRLHMVPRQYKKVICPLMMKYDHLYVCDVTNLPSGLGSIVYSSKCGWRFAPIGDPQIDIVLFRDSDSKIIERERSAVREWLTSKTTLHVAKDFKHDGATVPAGIFALRSDLGKMYSMGISMKIMLNIIRERMFNHMKANRRFGNDQTAIRKYLYPVLRNDMVRHETFNCQIHPGSWPFPSQRNVTEGYIGFRIYRKKHNVILFDLKCPKECRPPNHQDWENC